MTLVELREQGRAIWQEMPDEVRRIGGARGMLRPIGLVACARALALLRGRRHAVVDDVRSLAPDVLRHRLVLSYDALAEGVTPDSLIERVVDSVKVPTLREASA